MILSEVVCTCGSTVEILTTFRHQPKPQIGFKVRCTGVKGEHPIRVSTLGVAWLPNDVGAAPASWMTGIRKAIQDAIYKSNKPLGPHKSGVKTFTLHLKRDALELFRHAR